MEDQIINALKAHTELDTLALKSAMEFDVFEWLERDEEFLGALRYLIQQGKVLMEVRGLFAYHRLA